MRRLCLLICGVILPGALASAQTVTPAPQPAVITDSTVQSKEYEEALVDFKSGNYAEAVGAVEKAIQAQPQAALPIVLRGRIELALKQYDKAETDLRTALKMDTHSNQVYMYLGDLELARKKYQAAAIEYTMYHHWFPNDLRVVLKLFYCSLGSQDMGEAQRLSDSLPVFEEKSPAGYFSRAALAHVKGNNDEEKKYLDQAQTIFGLQTYSEFLPDYLSVVLHADGPPPVMTPQK